jgi:hypothetical protein
MTDIDSSSTYRPGQSVMCKVESIEPGGYNALVIGSGLPPLADPPEDDVENHHVLKAFLPSTEPLKIGQTVPATFVCMHNNRALMTFAFMLGTTERIQLSTDSDQDNAFAIWVDSYPTSQRLRRAIDLIMPAVSGKLYRELNCSTADSSKLLSELELANFTGCVKARSEEQKSRSAMLLYEGRVAGAIYGRKDAQETFAVEKAIKLIKGDIAGVDTFLQVYELPAEIVLAMSALFLGCPLAKDDSKVMLDYLDTTLVSIALTGETGCLTYSKDSSPDILVFINKGQPFGGYKIAAQEYVESSESLLSEIRKSEKGSIEAHILPEHLLSEAMTFGYKLDGTKA